jgi:serine protease Do
MQYNGQHVDGMEQFSRMVRETPSGREAKLDIVRGGAPQTIIVKVGSRHAPVTFSMVTPMPPMQPMEFHMPDMPRSFMSWHSSALGLEAESLEGQLAQYFGVKEGVLVRSVSKGSAAEKAGVKAGDVIIRIDESKVASPADLSTHIRSLRGKPVPMVLMRDRKEITLTVTIDDSDRSEFLWQDAAPVVRAHPVNPFQQ